MNRNSISAVWLSAFLGLVVSISIVGAQSLPLNITNVTEQKAEGEALVRELLAQKPANETVQTGRLKMRDADGRRTELTIRFSTSVTTTNWKCIYFAGTQTNGVMQLEVAQTPGGPGRYRYGETKSPAVSALPLSGILPAEAARRAFGGSDFSFIDLGLEFFHWPEQRVVRKEISRTRSCRVLDSINPEPGEGGYAKVRTWIDRETSGIVYAEAYDARGKLLKEFAPKEFKKVDGLWQLREMEMRNVQTGSRSVIEFDLATGP